MLSWRRCWRMVVQLWPEVGIRPRTAVLIFPLMFPEGLLGDDTTCIRGSPMATAFSRTLRSLAADGSRRALGVILFVALILGGWVAWCLLAQVAVYGVTQTARLEAERVIHPVVAKVAGQVVATRLIVGQEVQAGDVLVELEATAQRLS